MTPEEAFLQAIRENPADAIRWQMYADWLEERGDARATLYRAWRSTNSVGMTFVAVPSGTFWMGGGGGKCGREVAVEAFQLGIYPVTQEQWQTVAERNPSWFSRSGRGKAAVKGISVAELAQFPVEQVSWNDVQLFLQKLNALEEGGGWVYRLPSETEWEYACRGGGISREGCSFHFYFEDRLTNDLSSEEANFNGNYPDGKAQQGRYLNRPTRVGSYRPNRLGIYDMHGNVWEWCTDSWIGGPSRVLRGGSWNNFGESCRASFRIREASGYRNDYIGCRLARSPADV
jgi:uncharacterized protein (TIGR02996 family)